MAIGPERLGGAPARNLAGPAGRRLVTAEDEVLDPAVMHADQPVIEQVALRARQITDMVPV